MSVLPYLRVSPYRWKGINILDDDSAESSEEVMMKTKNIADLLAGKSISIMNVSTFSSDMILVRDRDYDAAKSLIDDYFRGSPFSKTRSPSGERTTGTFKHLRYQLMHSIHVRD
jgi:hypothetical protein